MKRKFLVALFVVLLVVSLGLTACKPKADVTITLNKTTLTLSAEGANGSLTATVVGSEERVTWASSDETVATVNKGMGNLCTIKPLKEGKTTITATIGEVSASCEVTVGPKEIVEEVTIYKDGTEVTGQTLQVTEGDTLNLTATASMGSSISWDSSDPSVAAVADGVITTGRPGTADITAYVSPSIRATVTVNVNAAAGSVYYDLLFGDGGSPVTEDGVAIPDNTFYYWASRAGWGQQVDIEYAYYRNGTVAVKYTSDWDPGYWYGFQLMCINTSIVAGNDYKFTAKITVDQDCYMLIADNIVELHEGSNDVTVFFKASSNKFAIFTGYNTNDGTNGYFVQNIAFEVSDMKWEGITASKLAAPSFTYDASTGIISITDPNAAGVGSYALNFYDAAGVRQSVVKVENGKAVDTSRVPNGTYTVKLVAIAANASYIDSDESESSANIKVNNASVSYELAATGAAGAVAIPGTWTYYSSTWVDFFSKKYTDGVVSFAFGNNAGNWDDTQLYYREPSAEVGKYYTFELTIKSDTAGHVIISGKEVAIEVGTHVYKIEQLLQTAGDATVAIIFALPGQIGGAQEIIGAEMEISLTSIVEVEAPTGGNTPTPDGDFVNGGETDAVANPNKMFYWNNQGWVNGNVVTVSSATYADGAYTFTYDGAVPGVWFGFQLFYKNSANIVGHSYTLTFVLESSVAGSIYVCGNVVAITAGTNNISATYTEAGDKASLSIQFGVENPASVIAGGTFTLKNIAFADNGESSTGGNQGGGNTPTPSGGFTFNGEADAAANPDKLFFWNDQWWCGSNVTVSGATYADGAYSWTHSGATSACWFGFQLFYKNSANVVGNTYTVSFTLESSVAGSITVNGQVIAITAGTNNISVTYTELAVNTQGQPAASLSIQFGVEAAASVISGGTFTLSDITFTAA